MKNMKTITELNQYIEDNVPFIIDVPSYINVRKNWMKEYEIKSLDLSFIITEKYDLIFDINQKYSNFYDLYISEEMLIKEVLQLIDDNKQTIYNIYSKRYELFNFRRRLLINSNFNKSGIYEKENIYFNVIDNYLSDVTRKGSITPYKKSFSCGNKIDFDKYIKDNETIFVIENGIFYISYDIFLKNLSKFLKTTSIGTIGILVDYIKSFGYYKYDIEFVENTGKFKDYEYYFSDEYKKYQTIIEFLNNSKKEENTFKTKYSNNNGVLCIVEEGRIILSHDKFIKVISKAMKIDIISTVTLIKDYFKEIHQIKHDNFIIVDNNDKLDNYVIDDKLFENILNYDKQITKNKEIMKNFNKSVEKEIEDSKKPEIGKLEETHIKTISSEQILEDRISELEKQIDANNELLESILNKISL